MPRYGIRTHDPSVPARDGSAAGATIVATANSHSTIPFGMLQQLDEYVLLRGTIVSTG
jgi:predicted aconitase with swiveling domain